MATYVYCPEHPMASEHGHVEKSLYLEWRSFQVEDKRMTIGNKQVTMHVITDGMDYTRHMCDNKYYDSKSAFRRATKENGCVEVGNETEHMLKPRKPKTLSKRERGLEIKKSIEQLKSGNGWTKERLQREVYSKPDFKLE